MRIVCAPDKFKGSLTAAEVAAAMREGILKVRPDAEVVLCPVADGGEGTVDCFLAARAGHRMTSQVTGPLGDRVDASWAMFNGGMAVLEMAAASGLSLLSASQRDPLLTTSRGTGELIKAAMDAGATRILLGLGGSATNDGGAGAAAALGVRFVGAKGPLTCESLRDVERVEIQQRVARLPQITLLADVQNPLLGSNGASHVYGPQKGARNVEQLEAGLRHFAALVRDATGLDIRDVPAAGAAGGMGGGLMALLGAKLESGAESVLEALRFNEVLAGADFCVTGEGRVDAQTMTGKACAAVLARCQAQGIALLVIAGQSGQGSQPLLDAATDHAVLCDSPEQESASMESAAHLVADAAARLISRS